MDRFYVQQHITSVSIVLFIVIYAGFMYWKPPFLYNKDGSLREFGIGYAKKTILPVWLLSIMVAIMCYLAVLYYVAYPKIWNLHM